jgi:hypothetical protein
MSYDDVSDDELVFLARQRHHDAERVLLERMRPKQDRMIFRLLKDNRYSGLEPGDLKTIAIQSLYHASIPTMGAKPSSMPITTCCWNATSSMKSKNSTLSIKRF